MGFQVHTQHQVINVESCTAWRVIERISSLIPEINFFSSHSSAAEILWCSKSTTLNNNLSGKQCKLLHHSAFRCCFMLKYKFWSHHNHTFSFFISCEHWNDLSTAKIPYVHLIYCKSEFLSWKYFSRFKFLILKAKEFLINLSQSSTISINLEFNNINMSCVELSTFIHGHCMHVREDSHWVRIYENNNKKIRHLFTRHRNSGVKFQYTLNVCESTKHMPSSAWYLNKQKKKKEIFCCLLSLFVHCTFNCPLWIFHDTRFQIDFSLLFQLCTRINFLKALFYIFVVFWQ